MASLDYSHTLDVTDGDSILFPVGTARDQKTGSTHLICSTLTGVEYESDSDRHLEVHTGQVIEDHPEQYTEQLSHRVTDYTWSDDGDDMVFQYYIVPQEQFVIQRWHCDDGQWVFETDVEGAEGVTRTEIVGQPAHRDEPLLAVVEEHLLSVGDSNE